MANPYQGALTSTFEGFNTARAQDPKKSAKDAFLKYGTAAGPAPIGDKAALGQWFNEKVRPGFEGEGHKVSAVEGDKFRYANPEGDFWVDYGRAAGSPDGALQWEATPGDDATAQRYGAPAASGAPTSSTMPVAPVGGQSDLLAQIMASLQAQQPTSQDLLLQQLR